MGVTVIARRYVIHGRVQGVSYRWFVSRAVQSLSITGLVRNMPDGTVEVIAEGPADHHDQLYTSLLQGPPLSRVDRITVEDREVSGRYDSFDITFFR